MADDNLRIKIRLPAADGAAAGTSATHGTLKSSIASTSTTSEGGGERLSLRRPSVSEFHSAASGGDEEAGRKRLKTMAATETNDQTTSQSNISHPNHQSLASSSSRRRSSSSVSLSSSGALSRRIVYGSYAQTIDRHSKTPSSHTHRWKVFLAGYADEDITPWVRHVVFHLHHSFKDAQRIVDKPPFEVMETGWGEFEVVIDVYFKDPKLRPATLYHLLKLHPHEGLTTTLPDTDPEKVIISEQFDELFFPPPLSAIMHHALVETPISYSPRVLPFESNYSDVVEQDVLMKIVQVGDELKQKIDEYTRKKDLLTIAIVDMKRNIEELEYRRKHQHAKHNQQHAR